MKQLLASIRGVLRHGASRDGLRVPEPWQRPPERPLVLGHRGASAHCLENTMEAFCAARDAGADGVELDVRLCASGQIVVFHDDDLARLTGPAEERAGGGHSPRGRAERIDQLSWPELRQIELRGGARVPLLADVLEELGELLVNVEIKSPGPGQAARLTARVIELLGRMGARERVLISSFDPAVVAQVRVTAPHVAVGYLFHQAQPLPLRRGWLAPLLAAHAVHPQSTLVTAETMRAWLQRGYAVNVWTVNDPVEMLRLADLGVNAVISDDPATALAVLAG